METIRNRAKDQFPMVLLTLLSIVQALALEFLWDHMRHRTELFEWSMAALPGWLQIIATFNIIILIWLTYAGMLMRFRWTPTTGDSIFPFLVGAIQFLMIDILGEEHFATWVIVLGVAFGAMVAINHSAMKRARRDGANREFFDRYKPARLADFVPQISIVATLLAVGLILSTSAAGDWLRIPTLIVVFAAVGYETHNAARYWKESMGEE